MTNENDLKFFRPMWRRVVVIALLTIWACSEFYFGDMMWMSIVLVALAYFIWTLIIKFPADAETPSSEDQTPKI